MAELVLGNTAFGNAARVRRNNRARAAAEIPILVGAMADGMARGGPVERHSRVTIARRSLAACDLPPVAVGW